MSMGTMLLENLSCILLLVVNCHVTLANLLWRSSRADNLEPRITDPGVFHDKATREQHQTSPLDLPAPFLTYDIKISPSLHHNAATGSHVLTGSIHTPLKNDTSSSLYQICPSDRPQPGILFDNYGPYNLKPLLGIKVHLQRVGTVPPEDPKDYARSVRGNWKCREGGILNCLFEEPELWNVMHNYSSSSGTTGMKAWDLLFSPLKKNKSDEGLIPCMAHSSPEKLAVSIPPAPSYTTKRYASETVRRFSQNAELSYANLPSMLAKNALLNFGPPKGSWSQENANPLNGGSTPCRPFKDLVDDDDVWNTMGQWKGTGRFQMNGD
ncbi:hypothetical protein PHLCEN_2v7369 [Hermanssonia centrifuga]|uniref:Uncharacterized protein n=1 Tax=Hermanssonia centrifuga TaxID=98765 RepID=A0A2R6NWY8_9APHY|nr:hypothetical protein PHLCEN_2v7369 [Hermanssonia centrifuga]